MRIPRWLHHLYADARGYFWVNCERCGRGFGGHQWRGDIPMTKRIGPYEGFCAYCPDCARTRREWERTDER
jgi:hypothetical protein